MTTCLSDTATPGAPRARRALLPALAALVLLAACAGEEGAGPGFAGEGPTLSSLGRALFATEPRTAVLAGGDLRLSAPDSWCVEPRSLRNTEDASFAMVASCRSVTQQLRFAPAPRGYATVVVGPALAQATPPADLLRAVVGEGTEIAAPDGDGIATARVPAAEGDRRPDAEILAWRGAAMVADRPVLLSVYAVDDALAGEDGAALMRALAAGIDADAAR